MFFFPFCQDNLPKLVLDFFFPALSLCPLGGRFGRVQTASASEACGVLRLRRQRRCFALRRWRRAAAATAAARRRQALRHYARQLLRPRRANFMARGTQARGVCLPPLVRKWATPSMLHYKGVDHFSKVAKRPPLNAGGRVKNEPSKQWLE